MRQGAISLLFFKYPMSILFENEWNPPLSCRLLYQHMFALETDRLV